MRLSYCVLAILIGLNLGSSLGFAVIFVRMLTRGSRRYLSSPPDLGITGNCQEYLFIGISWSGRSDIGSLLFFRCSDGLIFDNVEFFSKYRVSCSNTF